LILVHITTVPETLNFFQGQIAYMKDQGFEVHAVSSPGPRLTEVAVREKIPVHAAEMPRRITPLKDIHALIRLFRLFRQLKPDIVHAHTPKGGLLGVLAARLAGVPAVVYSLHGLPFLTANGFKRKLLSCTEAFTCRLSHRVLAVSFANRRRVLAEGFCPSNKIQVLGSGSCNGVDAAGRYNPEKLPPRTRESIREHYHIPSESLVLGYVGRIVRDKGITVLEKAWQHLRVKFPTLFLILIGPVEPQDPVPAPVMARLEADPRVRFTGWQNDLPSLYAAMDVLALPTYREGFPVAPLEAAAMGLPVVATRVDGCVEAVEDGVTGLLVRIGDSESFADAIKILLTDVEIRTKMGREGRSRVLKKFKMEQIWDLLYHEYIKLLSNT
jgi:glycosyltransferase involved in cell wall biosynthesis